MIEIEVLGARGVAGALGAGEVRRLCELTAARVGLAGGHLAVHFVDAERIASLNAEHRAHVGPTDVLSFPVDQLAPLEDEATRELGDIVICPEHTSDVREAVIHGMLHLIGMDHETDAGEMLTLQRQLLDLSSDPAR